MSVQRALYSFASSVPFPGAAVMPTMSRIAMIPPAPKDGASLMTDYPVLLRLLSIKAGCGDAHSSGSKRQENNLIHEIPRLGDFGNQLQIVHAFSNCHAKLVRIDDAVKADL